MYDVNTFPNILTVPEVAKYLRIGRTTAYALVKNGEIPSLKIGRQIRVFRDDLLNYVGLSESLEK